MNISIFLLFFYKIAQTSIPLCATAVWNSSVTVLAGSTSNAGSTPTFLSSPNDVTYDGYGNMYVVDTNNHRVQQFSPGIYRM